MLNRNDLDRLIMAESHKDVTKIILENNVLYDVHNGGDFTIAYPKNIRADELMPCFVSHTDTVSNNKPKSLKVIDGVMTNPKGVLGADDRAGCYILKQMIERDVRGIYIFTDLEEVGGIGAASCAKSEMFNALLENISCFIELDRENSDHCATYGYDNHDLINVFLNLGYREAMGSYTDVVTFSEATNIACVNLSIGYMNQHSKNEYLVLKDLEKTTEVMMLLPSRLYDAKYEVENIPSEVTEVLCDCCAVHEKLYYSEGLMLCELCIKYGADSDYWYDMSFDEGVVR